MATTWMKAVHRSGGSVAAALGLRLDYAMNPEKTDGGRLVDCYECNPITAQSEFLLSKKFYERTTGRNQGNRDVIAYHVRMSFPPGEVTPEQSLELGRELALRWTKGRHQFIVAAHDNTNSPHCHILFNSVNLDSDGKYQDFKRSAIALRRVSDQICLEHGLSVIEKPGLSKGQNRAEYLGERKAPTSRDRLRGFIDAALSSGNDFNSFIAAMQGAGCEVKRGKHLAFKLPDGKKFIRCDSLGDGYTEDAIRERVSGLRVIAPKGMTSAPVDNRHRPDLLVDIQAKLKEGRGPGYEHWGHLHNLKQASKTLLFLKDNGIDSYDDLVKKSNAVSAEFDARLKRLREIESRLGEITELQKQIGTYGKTREVFKLYKSMPPKKRNDFYEANRADITLHRAAKKHFDGLGLKKLPPMAALKQEYATLAAEKKTLYHGYNELRDRHRALLTAKGNAQRMLSIDENARERGGSRTQNRADSYAR